MNPGYKTMSQSELSSAEKNAIGHLDEILNAASMTKAEKRATFASWASDARALKDLPTLRELDDGGVIRLEDIFRALRQLDDDDDDPPPSPAAMSIAAHDLVSARQAA